MRTDLTTCRFSTSRKRSLRTNPHLRSNLRSPRRKPRSPKSSRNLPRPLPYPRTPRHIRRSKTQSPSSPYPQHDHLGRHRSPRIPMLHGRYPHCHKIRIQTFRFKYSSRSSCIFPTDMSDVNPDNADFRVVSGPKCDCTDSGRGLSHREGFSVGGCWCNMECVQFTEFDAQK